MTPHHYEKLRSAFLSMLALVGAGVEFSVAHEHVILRFDLTDTDSKRLIQMYDTQQEEGGSHV